MSESNLAGAAVQAQSRGKQGNRWLPSLVSAQEPSRAAGGRASANTVGAALPNRTGARSS